MNDTAVDIAADMSAQRDKDQLETKLRDLDKKYSADTHFITQKWQLQRLQALAKHSIRREGIIPLHAQGFWSLGRTTKVVKPDQPLSSPQLEIRFQADEKIIVEAFPDAEQSSADFSIQYFNRRLTIEKPGFEWDKKKTEGKLSEKDVLNKIVAAAGESLDYHQRRKAWNITKKTIGAGIIGTFLYATGAFGQAADPANDVLRTSEEPAAHLTIEQS